MASNSIKGLTVKIGADTSDFIKGLKSVDREINQTQKTANALQKGLKLDYNEKKHDDGSGGRVRLRQDDHRQDAVEPDAQDVRRGRVQRNARSECVDLPRKQNSSRSIFGQ